MSDKSQTQKEKLIKLQNLLASEATTQITVFYIKQLIVFFTDVNIATDPLIKNQIYQELRDTVKTIFHFLERVKPYNQITTRIQELIKKLLISISSYCSAFYCQYHPFGCGEMIRQFLSSQCRLFVIQIAAAHPFKDEKDSKGQKFQDYSWEWSRECSYKTVFFSRCIQAIMVNLLHFESKFQETKIAVIGQYLRLLYYMDDYIFKEKLQKLCLSHVQVLEKLFKSPSKQIMKQASKETLEQMIEYLIKLLRVSKNEQLKKRVNLLGVTLGMTMIKMNSIEKKILGSKIVNKFSYEMLYKNNFHLTEQYYAEWLVREGFFDAVFEDHCQTSIVKISDDTFKILAKRGCINKQKYQRFFFLLEKADSQLRKAMFRLIDPFRVDYYQIEAMNQIFKTQRSVDFYDDEFFYFYEGISRYATQNQLKEMIAIVQQILNLHYGKFHTYLTRRRAVECYAYIFEKLIIYKDMDDRINSYKRVAEQFLEDPSESKLIMLKTLYNNLSDSKLTIYYQEKLATQIIEEVKFLNRGFSTASNNQFREDLVYFIRGLLGKYKANHYRKGFSKETFLQAVNCPDILEEMLKISRENEVKGLLEQLSDLSKVKQFSFSCIKWTFIILNQKCLKPIKKGYADVITTYASTQRLQNFTGVDILTYLIFNSDRQNIRKGSSQLLAQIATNFTSQFRQEGQIYLVQFLKNILGVIQLKIKQFSQGEGSLSAVKGSLQLMEQLLLSTEYFGVGSLKAHNSQVPTSSVWIKIYNNCLQDDDTQKIFQKKFPSNKTLFEVIKQVSNAFKLGPLDIGLEYPNFDIIKHHGLTLEELKLNGHELNAVRLPQSRSKIESLLADGELSKRAKVIFTQIFNKYAVNGYLGHKQCSNYISGVTLTYCPTSDSRISQLFSRYDSDKDEKIQLDDFLKFYKECIEDPSRLENVEKNLYNLHYRSDLLPYDGEIEYNQQVLFRYYVWEHKEIYQDLFKLSSSNDSYLARLSQKIILRLPTYDKIISSLADTFDLKGKNSFEIEYMLTALQTHLNTEESIRNQLILKENHISIFEYLSILSQKDDKGVNDKNCLIICLHVLRSLLGNFNLKQFNLKNPQLPFALPATQVFINIIRQSIKNKDSTLLEPAFALQLTQNQLPVSLVEQSAFSEDKDTRTLTCNFLYLWILSQKSKDLNLFKIPVRPTHNEVWYGLLIFIVRCGVDVDYREIFNDNLKALRANKESLQGERYNPMIFGSLRLIQQIYHRLSNDQRQALNTCLTSLIPNLLSNENREIAYGLRSEYPELLLDDLEQIVNIKMSKEGQPRNKFVGIKNLGCICYMNSILQQFFMIKQFYNLIMSLTAKKEQTQINNVSIIDDFLAQLQEMYINLEWSQKQYYDPTNFCLAIKDLSGKPINTHIQQDAHEFLNTAFDKIEGYTKKQERSKELQRLFGGKTVTEVICQTCKNKNEVLEHYYHLSVEVKGMKSLKESFDKLIQIEEISDYFCEDCNKKVEKITKQMLIKESPEILIINLQRIIFDLQTFLKMKVHSKLQFQHTLDLHSYFSSSSQPGLYKLKGVVIHNGTSEGGHYYSLIKHEDKWYKFNDQSVSMFNQADIGRQAFGGEEVTDYWGQHTSSTNAYILFYERVKQNQQESQDIKSRVNQELIEKVRNENDLFSKQMQFNQPSFFKSLDNLIKKSIQNYTPDKRKTIQRLFYIQLKAIQHFSVNSDLQTQIVTMVKDNMLALMDILPEISQQFIEKFDNLSLKEIICNNSDVNIRDMFSKILAKTLLYLFLSEDELMREKGALKLEELLSWLDDQNFLKMLHKSYQYFDLLKDLLTKNAQVQEKLIEGDYLALLLDLLMGNESILFGKEKKRAQFHSSEAIPVVSIINLLIARKFGAKGADQQKKLTAQEKKVLNQSSFYRKMMKNKLDIGLLAPIISFMAVNDEGYSKMITEVLLKGMNSNDEIEDKNIVFANIRAFLIIQDELTSERIKWIIGVPQLESINFNTPEFGLMTSAQSLVYIYVSSLFFIKDDKYQPFLFTLFEKRKYFNSFSTYGALALLQLANESASVRNYILSIPAPTYIQRTYFDWIQIFANKIKTQQHYGLPIDKSILAEKLSKLIDELKSKIIGSVLYESLPVNKYIIGKNTLFNLREDYISKECKIELFAHETYILDNCPTGNGNISLPDDEFSFSSIKDELSKYFLKCSDLSFEEKIHVERKFTMFTFEIKNEVGLWIKFNIPTFNHRIYLKPGKHNINTPYYEQSLSELVSIEQIQQANKLQDIMDIYVNCDQQIKKPDQAAAIPVNIEDNFYLSQIQCKICTYFNSLSRTKCEMCDSDMLT